jgi:fimbrial chaperone protein
MGMRLGRRGSALILSVIATLGFVVYKAEPASAADISVSPVNISLTRDASSALLKVSNQGTSTVRFSLTTYAWSENEAGKIELAPTSDIIFFPTLLTLGPGEGRNVRLGTQLPQGEVEKTYRIILEEMPSPQTATIHRGLQVNVLSRISIPIFLAPEHPRTQASIGQLALQKGKVSFTIENQGSVHIPPGPVVMTARDEAGAPLTTKDVVVWYVLAGDSRTVEIPLSTSLCGKVRSLTLSMKIESTSIEKSLPTPSGACAP